MNKLVFALLSMPWLSWAAGGSTIYTFTAHTVRGPIGFTYIAPEPLTESSTYVNSWMFAGCDTTGAPGWICLDAYLLQTTVNGRPSIYITLDLAYPPGFGDGFAADQLYESFPGASLQSTGVFTGFLSPATLTITGPLDTSSSGADSTLEDATERPETDTAPGLRETAWFARPLRTFGPEPPTGRLAR